MRDLLFRKSPNTDFNVDSSINTIFSILDILRPNISITIFRNYCVYFWKKCSDLNRSHSYREPPKQFTFWVCLLLSFSLNCPYVNPSFQKFDNQQKLKINIKNNEKQHSVHRDEYFIYPNVINFFPTLQLFLYMGRIIDNHISRIFLPPIAKNYQQSRKRFVHNNRLF